jgi:hypothetical protein
MQGTFLLNIVITQSPSILQLFAGKDQSLLIRRNAFLVLNLGLDVFNGIRRLDIERNGFAGQSLDENLFLIDKEIQL